MRSTKFKKSQSGFTLIELVVVVVILGILAATALPRFFDMSSQARMAKMNAAAGAIKSAAAIAHAAYLAAGNTPATVSMEGTTVNLTNGYPDATATGIQAAAFSNNTDYTYTAGTNAAGQTFTAADSTKATCKVIYTSPAANASPTVDVSNVIAANC